MAAESASSRQARDAYETLRTTGVLVGDTSLGEWHEQREFREAYDWMSSQMNHRLATSGDGILWLWAKTNYRDFVGSAKRARGEVLLTVRVLRERALLSHFDDLHTVLNRSLEVPLRRGETYEEWSPRFDAIRDERDHQADAYRDRPIDEQSVVYGQLLLLLHAMHGDCVPALEPVGGCRVSCMPGCSTVWSNSGCSAGGGVKTLRRADLSAGRAILERSTLDNS